MASSRERTPDVDNVDGDVSQTHDETGGGSGEAPSEADESISHWMMTQRDLEMRRMKGHERVGTDNECLKRRADCSECDGAD